MIESLYLPIIGAFIIGILLTLISVAVYTWKKSKNMRKSLNDLPNPDEISEEELGLND